MASSASLSARLTPSNRIAALALVARACCLPHHRLQSLPCRLLPAAFINPAAIRFCRCPLSPIVTSRLTSFLYPLFCRCPRASAGAAAASSMSSAAVALSGCSDVDSISLSDSPFLPGRPIVTVSDAVEVVWIPMGRVVSSSHWKMIACLVCVGARMGVRVSLGEFYISTCNNKDEGD